MSDKQYQVVEKEYSKSAEIRGYDYEKGDNLEKLRISNGRDNTVFLNLTALQTFITFVLQIVGQSQTRHRAYRWTKYIFGILAFLAFILIALIGIVPTGGMIGIKRQQLPLTCGLLLGWLDVEAIGSKPLISSGHGATVSKLESV